MDCFFLKRERDRNISGNEIWNFHFYLPFKMLLLVILSAIKLLAQVNIFDFMKGPYELNIEILTHPMKNY